MDSKPITVMSFVRVVFAEFAGFLCEAPTKIMTAMHLLSKSLAAAPSLVAFWNWLSQLPPPYRGFAWCTVFSALIMFSWAIVVSTVTFEIGDTWDHTVEFNIFHLRDTDISWPGAFWSFGLAIFSGLLHCLALMPLKNGRHVNGTLVIEKAVALEMRHFSFYAAACSVSCWCFYAALCFPTRFPGLLHCGPFNYAYGPQVGMVFVANIFSLAALKCASDCKLCARDDPRPPQGTTTSGSLEPSKTRDMLMGSIIHTTTMSAISMAIWSGVMAPHVNFHGRDHDATAGTMSFVLGFVSSLCHVLTLKLFFSLAPCRGAPWAESVIAGSLVCSSAAGLITSVLTFCWAASSFYWVRWQGVLCSGGTLLFTACLVNLIRRQHRLASTPGGTFAATPINNLSQALVSDEAVPPVEIAIAVPIDRAHGSPVVVVD